MLKLINISYNIFVVDPETGNYVTKFDQKSGKNLWEKQKATQKQIDEAINNDIAAQTALIAQSKSNPNEYKAMNIFSPTKFYSLDEITEILSNFKPDDGFNYSLVIDFGCKPKVKHPAKLTQFIA